MEDKSRLISVFSSNDYTLFHMSKSILERNQIQYFCNSDYLINLESDQFPTNIKVFEKYEMAERKLLA